MTALLRVLEAFCVMTVAHLMVRFSSLARLQRLLDRVPRLFTNATSTTPSNAARRSHVVAATARAVGRARRLFPGDVRCLSSAATCTALLRLRGLPAQLVIGVRSPPFEAHARTELDGLVINDDVAVTSTYAVVRSV